MDDIFSQKVSASVGLGGKKIVRYMAALKKSGFTQVCRCTFRRFGIFEILNIILKNGNMKLISFPVDAILGMQNTEVEALEMESPCPTKC